MKLLLIKLLAKISDKLARSRQIELARVHQLSVEDKLLLRSLFPFTLTSVARMIGLLEATRYIVAHKIPGDFVECGVWRGGSMMLVAKELLARGDTTRNLYLFDTYEGMSAPTEKDRSFDGQTAKDQMANDQHDAGVWCRADINDVKKNLLSTGYPASRIHFIKGKVEETIPLTLPDQIALLRLDTDWYESTRHELQYLYPKLCQYGVLILDDYGHWEGAREAVDEYFAAHRVPVHLNRLDQTGRLSIKA